MFKRWKQAVAVLEIPRRKLKAFRELEARKESEQHREWPADSTQVTHAAHHWEAAGLTQNRIGILCKNGALCIFHYDTCVQNLCTSQTGWCVSSPFTVCIDKNGLKDCLLYLDISNLLLEIIKLIEYLLLPNKNGLMKDVFTVWMIGFLALVKRRIWLSLPTDFPGAGQQSSCLPGPDLIAQGIIKDAAPVPPPGVFAEWAPGLTWFASTWSSLAPWAGSSRSFSFWPPL